MNAQRKRTAAASQPAAQDNVASVLRTVALQPEPANAPFLEEPSLFRELEKTRLRCDPVGVSWDRQLPRHFGYRLAGVYRQLAGISGLVDVLQADFIQHAGPGEQELGDHLRERLFNALAELTHVAHFEMATLGDDLADIDVKARDALQGGEA